MTTKPRMFFQLSLLCMFVGKAAIAATLCVNIGGTSGCFKTINAAVSKAMPGDVIEVAAGTYNEGVLIDRPLALIGAKQATTIIDATNLANAIDIDGLHNPGLNNVVVTGFTIQNANNEGVLVTNATSITIAGNKVIGNDKLLDASQATCGTLPPFETAEGFDCGEGIHLTGVSNSRVALNTVENNAGGILLSDETGATHDNLITGNLVQNNVYDCGITLASHPPASGFGTTPLTVYHNTITLNQSVNNGTAISGAGAGVGLFAPLPGATVEGNVIFANVLKNNGLPGVAMHGHVPGVNLNNNVISDNYISGNGADTDDALTPGTTGINVFSVTPVTGTVITQNVFADEAYSIVTNTAAQVDIHLNIFPKAAVGIGNIGAGTDNATENWWGCATGPNQSGCASTQGMGITYKPWLLFPL